MIAPRISIQNSPLGGTISAVEQAQIQDWLEALKGVKSKRNGGYMALCPAHDDKNPSLSIDQGADGTVLIKCFAGCEYGAIREAAGLGRGTGINNRDRGSAAKSAPKIYTTREVYSRPVFEFRLPSGEIAYVQRHKGAYFRPVGDDEWAGNLEGVSPIPYRFPELIAGVRAGERVFHFEGCKDAENAAQCLGVVSTTTGGTNSWRQEFAGYYAGADVAIIPDNDGPGRAYAETVAAGISGVARSVKVVRLPDSLEGEDLTDWLNRGGTREQLLAAVEGAPEFTPSEAASGETPRDHRRRRTPHEARRRQEEPGHDELRNRWRALYPHRAYSRGDWWRYADGYWTVVPQESVERQVLTVLEDAKEEGVKVTGHLLGSVMKLARASEFVEPEKWDANTDILVCQNGTLEISTRTLREHRPEDYATAALPYAYDPDATPIVFLEALRKAIPQYADFLQEYAGYCLTQDTSLETALWFVGPRGCGKSTIIEGFNAMLGPRVGVLGLAEIEHSSFALSKIPGKTLLISTEQPASYVKSTHVIDALISGETLNIDRKYREAEEYAPVAKIIWAMNDEPRIGNTASGIFRRVKILRFPELPEGERDPEVKEAVKGEGAGILNWALEGLARLVARGRFEFPPGIVSATQEWEQQNDVPSLFVEDECMVGDGLEEAAGKLYSRYKLWCEDNGHTAKSSTGMRKEWERLGFKWRRLHGRAFYRGVQLRPSGPR